MPSDQIDNASVDSVARWDSLAMMNLVTLVEEEFEIQISANDLGELLSFELIHEYLGSKQDATVA